MQKTTTSQFLNRLFSALWDKLDPTKVDEFYHADVIGYVGAQQINIKDIKHRASFSQQVFASMQTEIVDVIVEDNKIAARLRQVAVRKDNKEKFEHNPMIIYQLRDNKVSHLWLLTDKPFDYKEKI